jgi:hypothetical protein
LRNEVAEIEIHESENEICVSSNFVDEFCKTLILGRKLILNKKSNELKIEDSVNASLPREVCWTFVLHPSVMLTKQKTSWLVNWGEVKKIARISSSLDFHDKTGYNSPCYGVKERCKILQSFKELPQTEVTVVKVVG